MPGCIPRTAAKGISEVIGARSARGSGVYHRRRAAAAAISGSSPSLCVGSSVARPASGGPDAAGHLRLLSLLALVSASTSTSLPLAAGAESCALLLRCQLCYAVQFSP